MVSFFHPRLLKFLCVASLFAISCPAARAATACVWRVTSVPHPFYLVGTIHALSGNDYPLAKAYDEALRNSQKLIFEIQPDPKSDFSDKFDVAATYPHGD